MSGCKQSREEEESSAVRSRAGLHKRNLPPSDAGSFRVHLSVYRSLAPLKDTQGHNPKSGTARHRTGIGGGGWRRLFSKVYEGDKKM